MRIVNKSDRDIKREYSNLINDLYSYFRRELDFDGNDVDNIIFIDMEGENKKSLGKTAFYVPDNEDIYVVTNDRYIKDILRSISHELIHHKQNCQGEIENEKGFGDGYAQKDRHLRNLEKEAYKKGNMMFRDFEDKKKARADMLAERMEKRFGFKFNPRRI